MRRVSCRAMRGPQERTAGGVGQASLLAGLAIFVALLTTGRSGDLLPSTERLVLVMAAVVVLAVIQVPRLRPFALGLVVVFLIAGGLWLRYLQAVHPGGSDVLPVTNEALSVTLSGGNPYDHFYTSSRPAGAPFPYPPINLLLHLPGFLIARLWGVRWTEVAAAWVVLVVLGRAATSDRHPLAVPMLAAYAVLPNLLNLVGDGSNDTSAGAVFVLYIVALAATADGDEPWRGILAGVLAAAALGTKQSSLPIVVAGTAWLFWQRRVHLRPYLGAGAAVLFVVSIPFVIMAGPIAYVKALTAFAGFHEDVYGWNIWVLAQQMRWPVASREDALVVGTVVSLAAVVVLALVRYRSVRTAVAAGTVGMAVMFLAQRWTAYSYFAQLLSVVVVLPLLPPFDWLGPRDVGPEAEVAPDADDAREVRASEVDEPDGDGPHGVAAEPDRQGPGQHAPA